MPQTPICVSVREPLYTIHFHPHSLGSGKTGNDTKYDQLHSITLFSKHAIAVRLVRGTFSRALIMGIILYH